MNKLSLSVIKRPIKASTSPISPTTHAHLFTQGTNETIGDDIRGSSRLQCVSLGYAGIRSACIVATATATAATASATTTITTATIAIIKVDKDWQTLFSKFPRNP